MGRGLYIHVPFCRSKCAYCDFYSVTTTTSHADYLSKLQLEAALHQGKAINTVFLGGGTPSLLAASELSAVLGMVSRYFFLDGEAEITIEINPGTISRAYLAGCFAAGINRLSFGVQSFSPELLQLLGRRHSTLEAEQAVLWAGSVGFPHINLDLIYGIPGQTLAQWRETLQLACQLPIDHLSLYALEVHAATPLGRALAQGDYALPEEDTVADMYQLARDYLPAKGLAQYEISNFARPGAECQHNLNYWRNGEYIGLGPAACSYLSGERFCNLADLVAWSQALQQGLSPVGQQERLGDQGSMSETMVLGLRLTDGIDGVAFARRYGQTLEQVFGSVLAELLQKGWLKKTERGYALPEQLVLVANQVLIAFLE